MACSKVQGAVVAFECRLVSPGQILHLLGNLSPSQITQGGFVSGRLFDSLLILRVAASYSRVCIST
jgi:hypothetical protein